MQWSAEALGRREVVGVPTTSREGQDGREAASKAALLGRYERDGYVIVPGALSDQMLRPAIDLLERAVDELAERLLRKGKIADACRDSPFERRLADLDPSGMLDLPIGWGGLARTEAFFRIATCPALLDVLEALMGPEISYLWSFQVRGKLPQAFSGNRLRRLAWHQDAQYFNSATNIPTHRLHIATVWVPLVDVDEANGCLWMIPGSHGWGLQTGARDAEGNMQSRPEVIARGTPVPLVMRRGDLAVFTNLTYHSSDLNRTDTVRWNVDLRYMPTPAAGSTAEPDRLARDYLREFGDTEGRLRPFPVRSADPRVVPGSWRDHVTRYQQGKMNP